MYLEIYDRKIDASPEGKSEIKVSVNMDGSIRSFDNKESAFQFLEGKKQELDSVIQTAIGMYHRRMK